MTEMSISRRTYGFVFAVLLVLTLATVLAARIDLGRPEVAPGLRVPVNVVVALALAGAKALLVMLFFMHLRYSPALSRIVFAAAFLWLAILVGITLSDYTSRGWAAGEAADSPSAWDGRQP